MTQSLEQRDIERAVLAYAQRYWTASETAREARKALPGMLKQLQPFGVPLRAIAREAGISVTTLSNVLSGSSTVSGKVAVDIVRAVIHLRAQLPTTHAEEPPSE